MSTIVVLRPDQPEAPPGPRRLAERGRLPERPVLALVDNGKPRARDLLELMAAELRECLPSLETTLLRKPSAAYPLSSEEATALAARAHLVLTGVGD